MPRASSEPDDSAASFDCATVRRYPLHLRTGPS